MMSNPINVLITLPFSDELVEAIKEVSPRLNVTVKPARTREDVPREAWAQVEVLYTEKVLPDSEMATNLRWIQFHWAGIDSLVNSPIFRQEGLTVTTLSGAAAVQMAEYGLMMLLVLGHRLPALTSNQQLGGWPDDRWVRYLPQELFGSTVGIVGYGSVGRQLAKLLHGMGAIILATKRDAMHPDDSGYQAEGLGDPGGDLVTRLYPPQALRSMLKECDFVVVTVPLTPETRNLIGADEFEAMKPTAFLVDMSRGEVVDHQALITVLKQKKIAGAALDVFPKEPLPDDSPLWTLPNVILTPHIAGISERYNARAVSLFVENLHRYLAEQPLYNQYNPKLGY